MDKEIKKVNIFPENAERHSLEVLRTLSDVKSSRLVEEEFEKYILKYHVLSVCDFKVYLNDESYMGYNVLLTENNKYLIVKYDKDSKRTSFILMNDLADFSYQLLKLNSAEYIKVENSGYIPKMVFEIAGYETTYPIEKMPLNEEIIL